MNALELHADLPAAGETRELLLDGPAGRLEAILSMPRAGVAVRGGCLVCHPHPLYGGTMTNKVAYSLASSALKAGLVALRFNFRGVGNSTGLYDEARGETDDAIAAGRWLRERVGGLPLAQAGFSFGAHVSLKAAATLRPARLVTISIPFGRYIPGPQPAHPQCPWLAVHSRDDDTVPYEETVAILGTYEPPPRLETFDGAGHFYHGRLTDLQAVVTPFLGE